MKNKILLILLMSSFVAIAQNTSTSPIATFDIRKKVIPPIIEFLEPPIFVDENANNAIDAQENFKIVFSLKNTGPGDGLNLRALLTASGATKGVNFEGVRTLQNINAGDIYIARLYRFTSFFELII